MEVQMDSRQSRYRLLTTSSAKEARRKKMARWLIPPIKIMPLALFLPSHFPFTAPIFISHFTFILFNIYFAFILFVLSCIICMSNHFIGVDGDALAWNFEYSALCIRALKHNTKSFSLLTWKRECIFIAHSYKHRHRIASLLENG